MSLPVSRVLIRVKLVYNVTQGSRVDRVRNLRLYRKEGLQCAGVDSVVGASDRGNNSRNALAERQNNLCANVGIGVRRRGEIDRGFESRLEGRWQARVDDLSYPDIGLFNDCAINPSDDPEI